MTNISIKQIKETMLRELRSLYPEQETEALVFRTLQHVLQIPRSDIYLRPETNVPKSLVQEIENISADLKKFEPLQYILGEAPFYGLEFKVNNNVLIPRPETEELVDWVLRENNDQRVKAIDLGTGSGCIAVSIAKNRPGWEVLAVDVSPAAIGLARENASINQASVTFLEDNMLSFSTELIGTKFGIIVCNPPYVSLEQKKQMQPNVLDHEPHLALFAPGQDPLVFYRAIASFANTTLEKNGKVYVELNEDFPQETSKIFEENGFRTTLAKDINGKYRMLKAYYND